MYMVLVPKLPALLTGRHARLFVVVPSPLDPTLYMISGRYNPSVCPCACQSDRDAASRGDLGSGYCRSGTLSRSCRCALRYDDGPGRGVAARQFGVDHCRRCADDRGLLTACHRRRHFWSCLDFPGIALVTK